MILQIPDSVVKFAGRFLSSAVDLAPAHIQRALSPMVTGIALSAGARLSLTAMGSQVYPERRHKSTTARAMRDRRFRTRELLWNAIDRGIRDLAPSGGKVAVGTCQRL